MKQMNFTLLLSLLLLLASCVTTKKYNALETEKNVIQEELNRVKGVIQEKQKLSDQYVQLASQHRQNTRDLEEMTAKYKAVDKGYQELNRRYDECLLQNRDLLATSSTEIKQLTERLAQQREELDRRSRYLDSLSRELQYQGSKMDEWQGKITELQSALASKDAKVAELRNKVNTALLGFTAAELTVTEKNGKLYVSLSQNLLFKSASDRIDPKGQQALQQLAKVLTANPEIEVTVEGHTDTDGTADYNWDLSTSRATSVVKLLASSGVEQKRMTAAGRSYFYPIAPNDTAENKSKNRRVEIILSPRLDELYQIIRN